MAKKKTPRKNFDKANPLDWHLWNEVTRSISPLKKKTQLSALNIKKLSDSVDRPVGLPKISVELTKKQRSRDKVGYPKRTETPASKAFELNFGSYGRQQTSPAPLTFSPLIIEPKLHRHVRRGRVPIDATIDLHGLNQADARVSLIRFVEHRHARGDRTLLVITGKGLKKMGFGAIEQRGVLRHMLPQWLREPSLSSLISGLETSAQHHGGEGAYYVRLKRKAR